MYTPTEAEVQRLTELQDTLQSNTHQSMSFAGVIRYCLSRVARSVGHEPWPLRFDETPPEEIAPEESLDDLTVEVLKQMASERGISIPATFRKADIIDALRVS